MCMIEYFNHILINIQYEPIIGLAKKSEINGEKSRMIIKYNFPYDCGLSGLVVFAMMIL